jgi:hypothetical protein
MLTKTHIEPMPETLTQALQPGLTLRLMKHHPRGRTLALWVVCGKLVRVVPSARA